MLNLIGVSRARGGGAGTVTTVTASSPLQSSGGATPNISLLLSTGSGSIVLATSPTIVTPTIASFANAAHNHQDAAGGGSLDAAAIGSGVLANARVNFAAPAAIGSTTPAAGAFTTLVATSTGVDYATKAFRVLDSNGISLMTVTSDGRVFAGVDTTDNYKLAVTKSAADSAGMGLLLIKDNKAGGVGFVVRGSGSANIEVVLQSVATGRIHLGNTNLNSQQFVLDTATGNIGVGTGAVAPGARGHFAAVDAVLGATSNALIIGHNPSGTVTAGAGTGLAFQVQTTSAVNRFAALIEAIWNDPTNAAAIGDLVLSAYHNANATLTKRVGFTVRGAASATQWAIASGTVGATQTGYTAFSNLSTDRTCDADTVLIAELADIVGTLIEDLKSKGVIAA